MNMRINIRDKVFEHLNKTRVNVSQEDINTILSYYENLRVERFLLHSHIKSMTEGGIYV